MEAEERGFSDRENEKVKFYTLDNGVMSLSVLNLGGIIQKWVYKDRDIVCGFDSADEYLASTCYYGAIIGRCCGRMYDPVIGGKRVILPKNEPNDTLHGGKRGFDKRIWSVEPIPEQNGLRLSYLSPDGEEGFPGNLRVEVSYLLEESTLTILYDAVSDGDTPVNLTNHSYFNLDGIGSDVLGHELYIPAYYVSECDENHVPTGKHLPCWGTPLDFNAPKRIGKDIGEDDPTLKQWGGYDHNYLLRKADTLQMAALIRGKDLQMEVLTDAPCLQLYTANDSPPEPMKYGFAQQKHRAFCIETQREPNEVNFDGMILRAGMHFRTETRFRLTAVRSKEKL